MKNKILYLSISFILISCGLYYFNNTNTGNFKRNSYNKKLNLLELDEKKFEVPYVESNIKKIINENVKVNNNNSISESFSNSNSVQSNEQHTVALFSPRDDIRGALIEYIEAEKVGIICAAFRLTDQKITKSFLCC